VYPFIMPPGAPLTVITAPTQPRSHPAPKTGRLLRPAKVDVECIKAQLPESKLNSEPLSARRNHVVPILAAHHFPSDGDVATWTPSHEISPKTLGNLPTPSATPAVAGGAGRLLLLNALQAFSGRSCISTESGRSPSSARINRQILRRGRHEGIIHDSYSWEESDALGEGAFGKVYSAKSKHDLRQSFAVKKILRSGIQDVDELWSEISILSDLDHPNVLRFLEAYDDYKNIYVVTELCLGGDLDQWLEKVKGQVDFAKRVTREVMGALAHCHSLGICHRDLKPANILLVRDSMDSPVRVADFGVAKRCSKGVMARRSAWSLATAGQGEPRAAKSPLNLARMSSFKGTPEFMAPEVIAILNAKVKRKLNQKIFYDFRCDIWSVGVIIHMLLTGDVPYSLEELSAYVAEQTPLPNLVHLDEGGVLAEGALSHFLTSCLNLDFTQRPNARDLQAHDWLQPSSASSLDCSSAEELANRFVEFTSFSPLKRAAMLAAARHLGPYEHEELRALYQKLDLQNSGQLTAEDLRNAMRQVPGFLMPPCPPSESKVSPGYPDGDPVLRARRMSPKSHWSIQMAMKLDTAQSGTVDYTEFLAAAMNHRIENRRDLAWAAFCSFDLGSKGCVSRGDLEHVVEFLSEAQLSELGELGKGDEVTFEQFIRLLTE